MTFNLETYELIDRYLKGTLSEEENALFEKQQNENPALTEEVRLQSLVNNLVIEKGLADIRKKVGEDLSNTKGTSWFKTIILLTAGLCVVTASILYFSSKDKVQSKSPNKSKEQNSERPTVPSFEETQKEKKESKKNIPPVIKDKSGSPLNETKAPVSTEPKEDNSVDNTTKTLPNPLEEKKTETTETPYQQQSCADIIFEVKSEPSCYQKQTGKIQILISSIKGGSKPYTYSIAGNDFGLASINDALGEGNYLVQIKDSKGCILGKQIQVTEKACTEFEDYSFNPNMETWKFPLKDHEIGFITIADKSGRIVYSSKIIHGTPNSWDGRSLNGDMLELGSYLYIIESNGVKIKQGYITILY